MADFKPIRSLEENVSTIDPQDGQLILTDRGNIYIDMLNKRVCIPGVSIPIVLTREEYDDLVDNELIETDRIYMIKQLYVE